MAWSAPTKNNAQGGRSDDLKTEHTISDLNSLLSEGKSADASVFAEMRSALLLVAGDHYQKKEANFYKRLRDTKELSNEQKLRLTKNHTRKICQAYVNNILSMAPGVGFTPKDEKSPHDQKVADMHHSVWRDAFERYNIDDLIDDWCDSFVNTGEVSVKIFFDPNKGYIKGYHPLTDAEGNPSLDEMGQPQHDESQPVYSGEFVFEEIYGFNLLRPVSCKDLRKAEWLGLEKMVDKDDLLLSFPDEEKKKFIQDSVDDTYVVFNAAVSGGYHRAKGQVSVREYYFRPCRKYPKGWFYITTSQGILAQGELPGGIFPIVTQLFDRLPTTPRGRGPVKQMRPYQAEINRTASKIAEHQITIGDDKVIMQNGSKMTASSTLPGIRGYTVSGGAPTILEGRSGAQYLEYMNSQISEMYMVMNVAEDSAENQQNLDPYVLLFRAARQKKKFQRYIKRFEKLLIQIVKTYLSLAKVHLEDDALIYAVGKAEQVNIPEFKQLPDLCYEVNIEAQSDDIETKMGKQIVLNHALQYIGGQLKPEDIGKILRASPIADFDESFDDMTMDYDNSLNDVLALDRGEQPPVNQYDNHVYNIKRLTTRTRKPDFKFLPPQVQQSYAQKIAAHQQMEAANVQALQRAEQGFIPTGGGFIKCDIYVPDAQNPGKQVRATFPEQALVWLQGQIDSQGGMQAALSGLAQGSQVEIAQRLQAPPPADPAPMGMRPPMGGPPQARPPMGNGPMPGHSPIAMG